MCYENRTSSRAGDTPSGRVDRTIEIPVKNTTSSTFGGRHLDTLFVTTASMNLDAKAMVDQTHAGRVFAFQPGVCGLAEPYFEA